MGKETNLKKLQVLFRGFVSEARARETLKSYGFPASSSERFNRKVNLTIFVAPDRINELIQSLKKNVRIIEIREVS